MQQKLAKIVLVGSPNVGKSVLFNEFTGAYVAVSNYPGTTVDVSRGYSKFASKNFEVIDTPGLYSLLPITDEERVTRQLLFAEKPDVVIHVIDAKNIARMLSLTLQLIDAGLPVVLVLNMIDEAEQQGVYIKKANLAEKLGIPVVVTSAIHKYGLKELKNTIAQYEYRPANIFKFSRNIEKAVDRVNGMVTGNYGMSKRMAILLIMQKDKLIHDILLGERQYDDIIQELDNVDGIQAGSLEYTLAVERQAQVDEILIGTLRYGYHRRSTTANLLDKLTRIPVTGIPILIAVLYLGLYQFVGLFGAGYLVDMVDNQIFGRVINPLVERVVQAYIPWESVQSLIIGEYGIFSLGVRYAAVIILPIVGTFFLAFAILEDCGYLPRLAMLVDRVFKYFGLNGRAVIPVTLGLGCGSMAIMVTRTLETRRERLIATFLLALTIPCSAQLGVVLALLAHNPVLLVIWITYVIGIFFIAGWLTAKILPGTRSAFYMELPPLRLPVVSNVLMKAYTRMVWYFVEILPVFIITSGVLWLGDHFSLIRQLTIIMAPYMNLLGLPSEIAQVLLLGFFRRDYGAAGLYDLAAKGILNDQQLLVSAITLTLFVPCVAQFAVMIKERGLLLTLLMVALIAVVALLSGGLVNWLIILLSISL